MKELKEDKNCGSVRIKTIETVRTCNSWFWEKTIAFGLLSEGEDFFIIALDFPDGEKGAEKAEKDPEEDEIGPKMDPKLWFRKSWCHNFMASLTVCAMYAAFARQIESTLSSSSSKVSCLMLRVSLLISLFDNCFSFFTRFAEFSDFVLVLFVVEENEEEDEEEDEEDEEEDEEE